jgi:hypothetical protein
MRAYSNKIIKQNKRVFSINFLLAEKYVFNSNVPFIQWKSDNPIVCSINNAKNYNTFAFFKNTSTIIS